MSENYETIKPGDTVIVDRAGSGPVRAKIVDRVTSTQIIVGALRFNRKTGRLRGGGYMHIRLIRATEEKIAKINQDNRRHAVEYFGRWKTCDQSLIDAVHRLIFPESGA